MLQLREVLHGVQVILQVVGAGTILGGVGWLLKKRRERFENELLVRVAEESTWCSAGIIRGDRYLRALRGLPLDVIVPPTLKGWGRLKLNVRALPHKFKLRLRMLLGIPSTHRIDSTLFGLWKRGLLQQTILGSRFYYRVKS